MLRTVLMIFLAFSPVAAKAQSADPCVLLGDDVYLLLERRTKDIAEGRTPPSMSAEKAKMTSSLLADETMEADLLFSAVFWSVLLAEDVISKQDLDDRTLNNALAGQKFEVQCKDGILSQLFAAEPNSLSRPGRV